MIKITILGSNLDCKEFSTVTIVIVFQFFAIFSLLKEVLLMNRDMTWFTTPRFQRFSCSSFLSYDT